MTRSPEDGMDLLEHFSLKGKVALITGATGYLGQAMALGLARAGAYVLFCGRNEEKLHQLSMTFEEKGGAGEPVVFDILDPLQMDRLPNTLKHIPTINVWVNNAHQGKSGQLDDAQWKDFDDHHQMACSAPFKLAMLFKDKLIEGAKQAGQLSSIVNIASMYGVVSPDPRIYGKSGENNPPFYGTAKASMIQLTRYLACHLAPKAIRVNALSPGPFPQIASQEASDPFIQRLSEKLPLGRVGDPQEMVGPLLFLASNASSFVTGSHLSVDGGWTAW